MNRNQFLLAYTYLPLKVNVLKNENVEFVLTYLEKWKKRFIDTYGRIPDAGNMLIIYPNTTPLYGISLLKIDNTLDFFHVLIQHSKPMGDQLIFFFYVIFQTEGLYHQITFYSPLNKDTEQILLCYPLLGTDAMVVISNVQVSTITAKLGYSPIYRIGRFILTYIYEANEITALELLGVNLQPSTITNVSYTQQDTETLIVDADIDNNYLGIIMDPITSIITDTNQAQYGKTYFDTNEKMSDRYLCRASTMFNNNQTAIDQVYNGVLDLRYVITREQQLYIGSPEMQYAATNYGYMLSLPFTYYSSPMEKMMWYDQGIVPHLLDYLNMIKDRVFLLIKFYLNSITDDHVFLYIDAFDKDYAYSGVCTNMIDQSAILYYCLRPDDDVYYPFTQMSFPIAYISRPKNIINPVNGCILGTVWGHTFNNKNISRLDVSNNYNMENFFLNEEINNELIYNDDMGEVIKYLEFVILKLKQMYTQSPEIIFRVSDLSRLNIDFTPKIPTMITMVEIDYNKYSPYTAIRVHIMADNVEVDRTVTCVNAEIIEIGTAQTGIGRMPSSTNQFNVVIFKSDLPNLYYNNTTTGLTLGVQVVLSFLFKFKTYLNQTFQAFANALQIEIVTAYLYDSTTMVANSDGRDIFYTFDRFELALYKFNEIYYNNSNVCFNVHAYDQLTPTQLENLGIAFQARFTFDSTVKIDDMLDFQLNTDTNVIWFNNDLTYNPNYSILYNSTNFFYLPFPYDQYADVISAMISVFNITLKFYVEIDYKLEPNHIFSQYNNFMIQYNIEGDKCYQDHVLVYSNAVDKDMQSLNYLQVVFQQYDGNVYTWWSPLSHVQIMKLVISMNISSLTQEQLITVNTLPFLRWKDPKTPQRVSYINNSELKRFLTIAFN